MALFLSTERLCMPWLDFGGACAYPQGAGELNGYLEGACALTEEETALWKPLVLLIPLRLGLSDINEAYIETLKVRFYKRHTVVTQWSNYIKGILCGFEF